MLTYRYLFHREYFENPRKNQKAIELQSMVWYNVQVKEKMAILPFFREEQPAEDTERTQRRNDNVPVATLEKQTGPVEEGEVSLERFRGKYTYNSRPGYLAAKRIFDILVAGLGGLVLAIPMAVIAAMIWLESPGPAIYKQERVGKDGKPFMMYKFRSMRVDAEKDGPQWAKVEDDRCTRIGHIIRLWHIDELPQILNVLKGEMSIVGPRPEREYFYGEFEKRIPDYRARLLVAQGLTCIAQINGCYDLKPEERLVYDVEYMEKQSLWTDIKCVLQTFAVLVNHKGAR